jgi:serine/threonine-protein kinase HipA
MSAARPSATVPKDQQVIVGMAFEDGVIVPVGVLRIDRSMTGDRDTSVGRFRYADSYLKRPEAVPIDPVHLPLTAGEYRFARFGGLPSALRDAAPDNWGRMLIRRYYHARGIDRPLHEVDYLLSSPSDRSSNLHFAVDFGSDGLPQWDKLALRTGELPEMQELKEHVAAVIKDPIGHSGKPLPAGLVALLTGSGGARPKVNLRARDGTFLAKLAHPEQDITSNAHLEVASISMAQEVGITVVAATSHVDGDSDFLTVRRFDRLDGKEQQMVSAMTVLDANDEAFDWANWSYPLLAIELDRWSSDPATDKEQLFRCMVLRAMLSDDDDHPRNYALIRDPNAQGNRKGGSTLGQWRLAPMYDCVVGRGKGNKASELAMTIGKHGRDINEANILSQCDAFGLSTDKARTIMTEIQTAVLERFPAVLKRCKVSEQDAALALKSVAPLNERARESFVQRLIDRMDAARDRDADEFDIADAPTPKN